MTNYIDVFIDGDSLTIRDYRHIWPSRKILLNALLDILDAECDGEVMITSDEENNVEFEIADDEGD